MYGLGERLPPDKTHTLVLALFLWRFGARLRNFVFGELLRFAMDFGSLLQLLVLVICRLVVRHCIASFLLIRFVVDKLVGSQSILALLVFSQYPLVLAGSNAVFKSCDDGPEPSHFGVIVAGNCWHSSESWFGLATPSRGVGGFAVLLACWLIACIARWFTKSTTFGRAIHVRWARLFRTPPEPDPPPPSRLAWSFQEHRNAEGGFGRIKARYCVQAPRHRISVLRRLLLRLSRWAARTRLDIRALLGPRPFVLIQALQGLRRYSSLGRGLVLLSLTPAVSGASSGSVSATFGQECWLSFDVALAVSRIP